MGVCEHIITDRTNYSLKLFVANIRAHKGKAEFGN